MDGSFACPECGSEVEVAGLAPGRQVRCGFCHRLLEVPYLPRVPVAVWKRRRFGHLKWVRWAWVGLGVTAAVALVFGVIRFVGRQYHSIQEGSIHKLVASSRAHEAEGQFGLALVELDAAIELARRAGSQSSFPIDQERRHRADLSRREVHGLLDALVRARPQVYPLVDWLNLIARAGKDPDLAELRPQIESAFRDSARRRAASELETALRESNAGRVVASLRACDRIARLLPHLAPDAEPTVRREAEALVASLVATHGVALEKPRGEFVPGSYDWYCGHFMPILVEALETKGYLPYRETSPWKSAWHKAMYQMQVDVSERLEGTYLSSENRLARIEARLTLLVATSRKVVWWTMPTARTAEPVPGLPAYLARSVAAGSARSAECERRLYENARAQIDEKLGQALSHMRDCCPR
jgi:hypothetical protein